MKKIKQKTRKGVSKRFKITGTGKVMRRAQNMRHLRRHKSKKAKRNYNLMQLVTGKWARKIKRMLGLG
ncbi:MAG TPA: 50S ribosomal protein L35 [Candidatus Pacebacteria bacterium]|nr:50S ribosomal protein L35 [Candidatus Paceibacterota bacterium]